MEEPMHRKLALDPETISVKSFETDRAVEVRGTVAAREIGPGCPWSEPLSCPATVHSCTDG
jgi:hypothetical protein